MLRRLIGTVFFAGVLSAWGPVSSPALPVVPSGFPSVMDFPSTAILRERLDELLEIREERSGTPEAITPIVRKAVLSLPQLSVVNDNGIVRQRPTGAMSLLSAVEAAGGSRRLRIRAGVERRADAPSPAVRSDVVVDVLVNVDGLPVRTTPIGEDDPDFLALFE